MVTTVLIVLLILALLEIVLLNGAAAVRIHPPDEFSLVAKQKPQRTCIRWGFLVGAGGFEPPKLKAADLQSVPIGHSGTRPYSLFVSFAGRLVYSIMQKGFCQLFFYLFLQMRFPCRETAEQRREKPCSHAGTAKSEKKASRKKLIGKLQEKLGTICEKCKTFCLCIEKRSKAWYIKNATKCNKMDSAFVTLWQIRRDK